jgi:hypothetical protein
LQAGRDVAQQPPTVGAQGARRQSHGQAEQGHHLPVPTTSPAAALHMPRRPTLYVSPLQHRAVSVKVS